MKKIIAILFVVLCVMSLSLFLMSCDGDNVDKAVVVEETTLTGLTEYGKTLSRIVVPDGVTSIGEMAFANCENLISVEIPSSVISIGSSAFSNCSGLTSIEIPSSVTIIGEKAFLGCNNITTATIPTQAISSIPKYNLTSVVINGGTSIGSYAFEDCSSLKSIEISDSVTSIGYNAFYGCSSLTGVYITGIVTSICIK